MTRFSYFHILLEFGPQPPSVSVQLNYSDWSLRFSVFLRLFSRRRWSVATFFSPRVCVGTSRNSAALTSYAGKVGILEYENFELLRTKTSNSGGTQYRREEGDR